MSFIVSRKMEAQIKLGKCAKESKFSTWSKETINVENRLSNRPTSCPNRLDDLKSLVFKNWHTQQQLGGWEINATTNYNVYLPTFKASSQLEASPYRLDNTYKFGYVFLSFLISSYLFWHCIRNP